MARLNVYKILALALLLILSVTACKNLGKKKTADKPGIATSVTAPFQEAPWDSTATEKKCYSNKGLTYDVLVTIEKDAENSISGTVESKDLETEHAESVSFTGTQKGNSITIKFDAKPPIVGKASQWTDKPWTLGNDLNIPFRAKNYDTNKWEDTNYVFTVVECK